MKENEIQIRGIYSDGSERIRVLSKHNGLAFVLYLDDPEGADTVTGYLPFDRLRPIVP